MAATATNPTISPPKVANMVNENIPPAQTAKPEVSDQVRFFRYFQHEITALQTQMDRLEGTSAVGGERNDAAEHCMAGIARLANEVKDASTYIPVYDQKLYGEAIKALQEKLAETKLQFAPRPRFAFKTARKNPSAISLTDAAELAAQKRRNVPGYQSGSSSIASSRSETPFYVRTPNNEPEEAKDTDSEAGRSLGSSGFLDPKSAAIRRPTFSKSTSVSIDNHSKLHIILPTSASHAGAPASITALRSCIVDMSVPTTNGRPYANLTVKAVRNSLVVCGQVDGAAHITDVKESVIVVSCHQFRMHECKNVKVYLSCSSRPIIEDCTDIKFARLPEIYATSEKPTEDLWDQVDDFKWLKAQHSPNWSLLEGEEIVPEDVWRDVVPGGPGWSMHQIMTMAGVTGMQCARS